MKTGVILPSFSNSPDEAIEVARIADASGVDGVFAYDHVWPIGQPERPALSPFPLLGAIASETERVVVGTLVARVGLAPDEVLLSQFHALDLVTAGRVVAALGVGDRNSREENVAYGIAFRPIDERLGSLARCVSALKAAGIEVWVGSGHIGSKTVSVALDLGVAVNLWNAPVKDVAGQAVRSEVTWAGPLPRRSGVSERTATSELIETIATAGASWVILPWPAPLDAMVDAAAGTTETVTTDAAAAAKPATGESAHVAERSSRTG